MQLSDMHKASGPIHCKIFNDSLLLHVSARSQVKVIFRKLQPQYT
jgi:hypothetical protein